MYADSLGPQLPTCPGPGPAAPVDTVIHRSHLVHQVGSTLGLKCGVQVVVGGGETQQAQWKDAIWALSLALGPSEQLLLAVK